MLLYQERERYYGSFSESSRYLCLGLLTKPIRLKLHVGTQSFKEFSYYSLCTSWEKRLHT